MIEFYVISGIAVFLALAFLIISYVCFRLAFYSRKRIPKPEGEYSLPKGKLYEPYLERIKEWQKETFALPHEDFEIRSHDGLTLKGKYYEHEKGAPLEILFHGYRGNPMKDLSGAVERCFKLGRNALLVTQRAHGESDGSVISFGVNERRDCLRWVDFAISRFGEDTKIILTGLSMGASTVLMAAGEDLPENVVCILADCGYSSQKEIIKKVIGEMGIPQDLAYPFVKAGAFIFGHFRLEETTPIESVKRSRTPIIFIHGDSDDFVPYQMSLDMYKVCPTEKTLITVEGAGHALAFIMDQEGYIKKVKEFDSVWKK